MKNNIGPAIFKDVTVKNNVLQNKGQLLEA